MSFKPSVHTTNDVVRLGIIPLTSSTCSSYAELLNRDRPLVPSIMVTHNWSNLFRDLVASIVAHAMGEHSFDFIAELLSDMEGTKVLEEALLVKGLLTNELLDLCLRSQSAYRNLWSKSETRYRSCHKGPTPHMPLLHTQVFQQRSPFGQTWREYPMRDEQI